uniref:Glucosidase 2 subunit beta n=1 Tax=Phallusia mammillata TaxID=59560 RepID=A0A6F9DQI7_9ASCI|nr:glucosidase 2 subunit beta [Phallusia mammillata]
MEPSQRHVRLMGGRSNPFQTLFALFITALFFMFFQASILKNLQRQQQMLINSGSEVHNKGKYSHLGQMAVAPPEIARSVHPKFAQKLMKEIGMKVNGTLLRGVKKEHRKYYVPSKEGTFTCLSGNQTVAWISVNNDYCDCADGSDEPGTSACHNGKFYCEPERHFLPSSRVNDGICDCCDGSDEWKGVTVPPDLELPVSEGVQLAPCSDTCRDYDHMKLREHNILKEAASLKPLYIEKGLGHGGENYGPNGEFYFLTKKCYVFKSPGYMYELCPYANATQNGKDSWLIGTGGKLEGNVEDGYNLVMGDGKGDHCPQGKKRTTIIAFTCGVEDKVKYVSEKETCVYGVKFDTPAACPDLETIELT